MSAIPKFYRLKQVKEITGFGASSIYYLISRNLFVKQVKLGARSVGWPAAEVDAWAADRIASSRAEQTITAAEQEELHALLARFPDLGAEPDTSGMEVHELRSLLQFLRRKAKAE